MTLQKILKKIVSLKFVRSSGPGGQNVNKVSTCVQARLDLRNPIFLHFLAENYHLDPSPESDPESFSQGVLNRIKTQNPSKITKSNELILKSMSERTQELNREVAIQQVSDIISQAMIVPKERHIWTEIGEKGKQARRNMKSIRKSKKDSRRIDRNDF